MNSVINPDMKLSEHFLLREFLRSQKAQELQIPNTPLKRHVTAMENLCRRCLEPTRQHFQWPLLVTSGYRCEPLNRAVGGSDTSQHMRGEAADITVPRKYWPFCYTSQEQIARVLFDWMRTGIDFDQLILEHSGQTWWVHVSCRIDYRKNRHQILQLKK